MPVSPSHKRGPDPPEEPRAPQKSNAVVARTDLVPLFLHALCFSPSSSNQTTSVLLPLSRGRSAPVERVAHMDTASKGFWTSRLSSHFHCRDLPTEVGPRLKYVTGLLIAAMSPMLGMSTCMTSRRAEHAGSCMRFVLGCGEEAAKSPFAVSFAFNQNSRGTLHYRDRGTR